MHLLHWNPRPSIQQQATILLVESDDDEINRLRAMLTQSNLDVSLQVVSNSLEAVYYLAGKEPYEDRICYPLPVLVITPLNMRKFSGLDLFKWIKHQPQLQNLPVSFKVALDGENSASLPSIAQLDSLPYLSHSHSYETLIQMIRYILHPEIASEPVDAIMTS